MASCKPEARLVAVRHPPSAPSIIGSSRTVSLALRRRPARSLQTRATCFRARPQHYLLLLGTMLGRSSPLRIHTGENPLSRACSAALHHNKSTGLNEPRWSPLALSPFGVNGEGAMRRLSISPAMRRRSSHLMIEGRALCLRTTLHHNQRHRWSLWTRHRRCDRQALLGLLL